MLLLQKLFIIQFDIVYIGHMILPHKTNFVSILYSFLVMHGSGMSFLSKRKNEYIHNKAYNSKFKPIRTNSLLPSLYHFFFRMLVEHPKDVIGPINFVFRHKFQQNIQNIMFLFYNHQCKTCSMLFSVPFIRGRITMTLLRQV